MTIHALNPNLLYPCCSRLTPSPERGEETSWKAGKLCKGICFGVEVNKENIKYIIHEFPERELPGDEAELTYCWGK